MIKTHIIALSLAALFAATIPAQAGEPAQGKEVKQVIEAKEKTLCEKIFDLPTLYHDKENPIIQKFALVGRYHGQYYTLDSNQGNADDWENRRARIGAEAQIFHVFKLNAQFNLNLKSDEGRFFEDLEEATIKYSPDKSFTLSIGKQKAPITHEWRTSSNKILTFERSAIINNMVPEKLGGVLASYTKDGWLLDLGVYTNSVDDDWAYPTFDGGFSIFGSVGYKAENFGTLRAEYLYSDLDEGVTNVNTRGFAHVFSLNYHNKWGRFGLMADAMGGVNDDTGNIYGLTILPTYEITDKLLLVTRYQIVGAEDDHGFRAQRRYEREAPDLATSRGDFYQAVYAGLNYYICGDNLKLMTGVEYTNFEQAGGSSLDAWTWFSGVRVFF